MELFEGFGRRIEQLHERNILRSAKLKEAKLPTVTQTVEITVPQDVGIFIQNEAKNLGRPASEIMAELAAEGVLSAAYDPDEKKEGKRAPNQKPKTAKGKQGKSGNS